MRIHPRRHRKPEPAGPHYRVNEMIHIPQVRVIDENDEQLGVLETGKALAMAQERGYDLVEVAPKAEPPVCKFLDFGQFKYEKDREARKQKKQAKQIEVKGIRLTPRIGKHDIETRLRTAKSFLEEGDKVKIEMRMRGREKAFADLARQTIEEFVAALRREFELVIEQPIQNAAGQLTTILRRK